MAVAVVPVVEPQETEGLEAVVAAGWAVLSQSAAQEVSGAAAVAVAALVPQLSRQVVAAQFCCSGRRAIRDEICTFG